MNEPSPEADANEDDPASDSFGNEDEIEEYIRKHLDEEASKDKDDQMKAKLMLAQDKVDSASGEQAEDSDEESFPESDAESVDLDSEQITPKQALINGLIRLGDPKSKKYSLSDREHFVFDFEQILKILTFRETVEYIFPALDVYAAEQEYLKIELFK